MKNNRFFTLFAAALLGTAFVSAQTADEIIGKHLSAIGGKKVHDALKAALEAETDDKVKEAITEAMQ